MISRFLFHASGPLLENVCDDEIFFRFSSSLFMEVQIIYSMRQMHICTHTHKYTFTNRVFVACEVLAWCCHHTHSHTHT